MLPELFKKKNKRKTCFMTHPLLVSFGLTYDKKFPLILVVGREPNNETVSDKSFWHYDFNTAKNRRCAFWNTAFGLFGLYNGLRASQMKELFNKNQSSPIVFTDASPKGIKNSVANKKAIRNTVTIEELTEHIDAIFVNENLLDRIKLTLLSGLEDAKYDTFKTLFKQKASEKNILIKEIPFLIGYNSKKIKTLINDKDIEVLRQVFEEFNNNN